MMQGGQKIYDIYKVHYFATHIVSDLRNLSKSHADLSSPENEGFGGGNS